MNIISVWWAAGFTGGRGQYRFSKAYPDSLKNQLRERGHDLTVLSDTDYGRSLLSPRRYRGWWAKVEVFRPENRDLRPCLCVDLDTFILGNIDPILELDPTRFWMIRDFYRPNIGESGLFIAPKDGISDRIWECAEKHHDLTRGDGAWLRKFDHSYIQDEVDGILSYKVHRLEQSPKNARVVCFHGKPKCEETKGWAKEFWTRHAMNHGCTK